MVRVIRDCASGLIALCVHAQRVPVVDHSPKIIDFGKVRIGAAEQSTIRLYNKSTTNIEIINVTVISVDPVPFTATNTSANIITPDQSADIRVTAALNDTNSHKAFVGIEFRYVDETLQDVRMIECKAEGCEVAENACIAPVFSAGNIFLCLLFFIIIPLIIAVLALFIWIPGVFCTIKKLWFRLNNCSKGNDDPCIVL
jgi:hypothetical protein